MQYNFLVLVIKADIDVTRNMQLVIQLRNR